MLDSHGHRVLDETRLRDAKRFEPIEIQAISQFLLNYSQPFEYLDFPEGVEQPSAERGKRLVPNSRLPGLPQAQGLSRRSTATQGPDLSRIGAKLDTRRTARGAAVALHLVPPAQSLSSPHLMPNLIPIHAVGRDHQGAGRQRLPIRPPTSRPICWSSQAMEAEDPYRSKSSDESPGRSGLRII